MEYDRYDLEGEESPDRGTPSKEETGENSTEGSGDQHAQLETGINNWNIRQMVERHQRELKESIRKLEDQDKTVPNKLQDAYDAIKDDKPEPL